MLQIVHECQMQFLPESFILPFSKYSSSTYVRLCILHSMDSSPTYDVTAQARQWVPWWRHLKAFWLVPWWQSSSETSPAFIGRRRLFVKVKQNHGSRVTRPALSQCQSLVIRRLANFIVVQKRHATYFEAPKLRKGQSGSQSVSWEVILSSPPLALSVPKKAWLLSSCVYLCI